MTIAEIPSALNDDTPGDSPGRRRRWPRRIAAAIGLALLAITLLAVTLWSILAINYSGLAGRSPRTVLAALFAIAVIACLIFIRPRRYGVMACFGMFLLVVLWFFSLQPSNERDWADDVAFIPSASIDGNQLTVRNVRNFDYRSETDFTPRWENRTYDLSKLQTADMMLVYWGSKAIAHAMVSFGFDGDQYLAISIEARRQKSESYSAIQGFFRQFELIYVVSDERDVVRLRTNYRHEDVYLYRSTLTPDEARQLLLSYMDQVNALYAKPKFYNALTSNCATNVLDNARLGKLAGQMSWRVLLSGYAAQQMYDNRRIDTSLPFPELEARSHVNAAAVKADQAPDFSKLIRVGLPDPVAATHVTISQQLNQKR